MVCLAMGPLHTLSKTRPINKCVFFPASMCLSVCFLRVFGGIRKGGMFMALALYESEPLGEEELYFAEGGISFISFCLIVLTLPCSTV